MAIKFCFYGTSCYDLILYAARVLKQCKMSVLLLDYSKEQSLSCAIPEVKGLETGIRDYRGLAFSKDNVSSAEQNSNYDVVFLYLGEYSDYKESGDYNFIVTDCELHTVERTKTLKSDLQSLSLMSDSDEKPDTNEDFDVFERYCLNLIILGVDASARAGYISSQMEFSGEHCSVVDMDESNLESRIRCQYDEVFRFNRISDEYKDLVNKLCYTALLGSYISEKNYRKAYQKAERGK